MAVKTVAELIAHLTEHRDPEETLVYTYWCKDDLQDYISVADDPDDLWNEVADTVDGALEQQTSWVNDVLADAVSDLKADEDDDEYEEED